jgi:hypothetical protein
MGFLHAELTKVISRRAPAVLVAVGAVGLASGCTALGPMPGTTAASMVPARRPDVDAQLGLVPGYFLSSSVQSEPHGSPIQEASLLVEPERLVGVPGVVVGGRYVGKSENGGYGEPMVGYRTFVDENHRLSAGAVAYGIHASGSAKQASYAATRGGVEAGLDVQPFPENSWFEPHLLAAASLTGLSASGDYCVDAEGQFGIDCPDMSPRVAHATAGGLYPSVTAGVAIDLARHLDLAFHGGRIALMAGAGTMPAVVAAQQTRAQLYGAAGLTVTVGFGAVR